jgi:hypothetical protein
MTTTPVLVSRSARSFGTWPAHPEPRRACAAPVVIALLAGSIGCQSPKPAEVAPAPAQSPAAAPGDVPPTPPPTPAALVPFRRQLEQNADQLDANYRVFAAALPGTTTEVEYHDFVQQMSDPDPNVRANGICGVAAARRPASLDHLLRALNTESDPFNRTMIVWCLRQYEGDPRVATALEGFIPKAPDIDFQRCLGPNNDIVYVRFPPPLAGAAYEAFKALLAIRGRAFALHGAGWKLFVDRFNQSIDIQPVTAIDMSRFESDRAADINPRQRAREWIDEMNR